MIRIFPVVLLLGLAPAQDAAAASAVVYDSATGIYAYRHSAASAAQAEQAALLSCKRRGGNACEVIVSCDAGGFGMIYSRRDGGAGARAIGASCAAGTHAEANEIAKSNCNAHIGARSASCGGPLGQCRCGGPRVQWRD